MIRLTRAGEYAIRAVLYLAAQPNGQVSGRESVAEAQAIPVSFLSKILQRLSLAGIVRSYKGSAGGFSLARPAEEITLLDVLRAVEGPLAVNKCLLEPGLCHQQPICPVHPVWRDIQKTLESTLGQVSFAQLAAGWSALPPN